ncbi:MAG: hypothetical protein KJ060_19155 [Candidatus Hydrogenedentes bacterium]|nr:hypothetical protein [Candidatus Hydrogenedentota bacterium]
MFGTSSSHQFNFVDWNVYRNTDESLVYRPGMKTLLRRLAWSFVAVVLIVGVQYGYHEAISRLTILEPRGTEVGVVGPDEQVAAGLRYARIALTILLGGSAILVPLLALIEQLTIRQDVRGDLVIARRQLWPRTVSCPGASLSPLSVIAREQARSGGNHSNGYQWIVLTYSDPARGGTGTSLEFHVDHSQFPPTSTDRLPERAATFVDALRRLTGVEYQGPIVTEADPFRSVRRGQYRRRGPVVTKRFTKTFGNVPPELQGEVESLMARLGENSGSGFQHEVIRTERITVKDADGNVRTYNSAEELPPEMRAVFDEMRRRHESGDR